MENVSSIQSQSSNIGLQRFSTMWVLSQTCSPDLRRRRARLARGFIKFYNPRLCFVSFRRLSSGAFYSSGSPLLLLPLLFRSRYNRFPVSRSLTLISMLHYDVAVYRQIGGCALMMPAIFRGLSNPANKPPRQDGRDRDFYSRVDRARL